MLNLSGQIHLKQLRQNPRKCKLAERGISMTTCRPSKSQEVNSSPQSTLLKINNCT